jgi:hypothetical protein
MAVDPTDVRLLDAWQVAEAQTFFRNVWAMYVHEIATFDTDLCRLAADGRWQLLKLTAAPLACTRRRAPRRYLLLLRSPVRRSLNSGTLRS